MRKTAKTVLRAIEKAKKKQAKEKAANSLFLRRTNSVYRAMTQRFEKELPFTVSDLRLMVSSALGKQCPYCEDVVKIKTFSLDHMMPVSRGGNLAILNLMVVCKRCNLSKGQMSDDEYRKFLKTLSDFPIPIMRWILGTMRAGATVVRLNFLKR